MAQLLTHQENRWVNTLRPQGPHGQELPSRAKGKGTAEGDEGSPKEIVWALPDCGGLRSPWKQRQTDSFSRWVVTRRRERNKATPV